MIRFLIALWFAIIPSVALCQGTQNMEDTLRQLSKDLATLHQEIQATYRIEVASQAFVGGSVPVRYSVTITKDQSPI